MALFGHSRGHLAAERLGLHYGELHAVCWPCFTANLNTALHFIGAGIIPRPGRHVHVRATAQ